MPTMVSTTLTAAIDATTQQIPVASATGFNDLNAPNFIQTVLYVDREAMVLTQNINQLVATVQRGALGTAAKSHASGATVYVGKPNQYGLSDPSGAFNAPGDAYLPLVVIPTGRIWNNSGGTWTEVGGGSGTLTGPQGSATLNFGAIGDGNYEDLTFTVSGAVANDKVAPSWPTTLDAGLVGSMYVSAADTITVRLVNISGASINPASATYGAQIVRS